MAIEIPVIKKVIIGGLSAGDKRLAEIFDISVTRAGTIRREMAWFPAYKDGVQNKGKNVDIEIFQKYFTYRGTYEWEKEKKKIDEIKKKNRKEKKHVNKIK